MIGIVFTGYCSDDGGLVVCWLLAWFSGIQWYVDSRIVGSRCSITVSSI